MSDDTTVVEERTDPEPKDAQEAITLAVDRANEIQALLQAARIPLSDTTVTALTLVAATNFFMRSGSLNDAWSLFLAVHEHAELNQQERMEKLAEQMKNSLHQVVARVFQLPEKPETKH